MANKIVVIQKEIATVTKRATQMVISNQAQYEKAGAFLKTIKALQKRIRDTFDPIVNLAHKTHQEAIAKRKEHLDPTLKAESILKDSLLSYRQEQERIRQVQEEKLRKKAAATEERKRKSYEEQARKQEERAAELRRQAEEADAKEKEALEENARKADEQAELRREKKEDVHVDAPIIASSVGKVSGISTKTVWRFRVVDESLIPREYLCVDAQAIAGVVKSTKGQKQIPGIEIYSEEIMSSGT